MSGRQGFRASVLTLAVALIVCGQLFAADGLARPIVGRAVTFAESPPLRVLAPVTGEPGVPQAAPAREITLGRIHERAQAKAGVAAAADPVVQDRPGKVAMPGPLLTFEGLGNDAGVLPPDPNGDVGPNHYVEAVNLRFQVFDKLGTPLTSPTKISSLFASMGGPAATYDDGDPIVLYDPLADRWLISQFVVSVSPCHQVIAVSKSGDPTGGYYLYDFVMPNAKMNDYSKFGVWPDAYYMTDNQFVLPNYDWGGVGAFAFDRSRMLAGDPTATYIYFDLLALDPQLAGMLPADLDGPPPPAGAPNYFACLAADEWGDAQDGLRIFSFHPDFAASANSTFTQTQFLATAPFDPNFVGGRNNIPQPGTAQKLDAISDRL